jgi:hypothetical protein
LKAPLAPFEVAERITAEAVLGAPTRQVRALRFSFGSGAARQSGFVPRPRMVAGRRDGPEYGLRAGR